MAKGLGLKALKIRVHRGRPPQPLDDGLNLAGLGLRVEGSGFRV
jgi:hypothetical protein